VRLGIIPQTVIERLALASGRVPEPIVEAFLPLVLARSIMAATRLGIFATLAREPQNADMVAQACGADRRATSALLEALASADYLVERNGVFSLTRKSRPWLAPGAPGDTSAYIRFNYLQWDWLGELESFIENGVPISFHQRLTTDQWKDYEQGMASIARLTLPEVVWRTPMPAGATAMLDIGGGHGLAAARFCQRYPTLRATVLDLPQALESGDAFPTAVADRVIRIEGDALTADLGVERYDLIYVANLLHHFCADQIAELATRIAVALRPGGIWEIQDGVRERRRRSQRMPAALGDLYFALTSASGFRSFAEMASWQKLVGLRPLRPIHLWTAPGQGLQVARKPGVVGVRA
jgi:hypothetical protein